MDVIRSVKKYNGTADNIIMVRYLMGVAYLPLPLARILYQIFLSDPAHLRIYVFFGSRTRRVHSEDVTT
jgi:hypothetical protein